MNINEAIRILIENRPRRKWDTDALDDAIDAVAEHFKPVQIELEGGGTTWWHVCEDCHGAVDTSDLYCKHCGRKLIQEHIWDNKEEEKP